MSYINGLLFPAMMLVAVVYGWNRADPHAAIDPAGEPAAIRRHHLLAVAVAFMAVCMAAANLIPLFQSE